MKKLLIILVLLSLVSVTHARLSNPTPSDPVTPSGQSGSVQFNQNGSFSSGSLFWDDVNKRLGVGTTTPKSTLHIVSPGLSGSGGTPSDISSDKVHRFISSGNITITGEGIVEYLIVGGGGGGGNNRGGGGGGGGVIYASSTITAGIYPVIIGNGAGGAGTGGNSSVFGFTAIGGGSGASTVGNGGAGGSGGGGSQGGSGGSPTTGQGSVGGAGDLGGGGGGGASVAGSASSGNNGGNGGQGRSISITGSAVVYGSGGGGGNGTGGATQGTGGTNAGSGAITATNGVANTGGGGGGNGNPSSGNAGSGGSGIVIIRYTPIISATSLQVKNGAGDLEFASALTLSGATTTASKGFNLTGGCFAIAGICIGGGTGLATTDINTSLKLSTILTDETGTGRAVFGTDPNFRSAVENPNMTSTGGTVSTTTVSGQTIVTYNADGSFKAPDGIDEVWVLVVGGGASGGSQHAGGGGGGGVVNNANFPVTPGATITVTVGGGGAAVSAQNSAGNDGADSVFSTITAGGGGGAGNGYNNNTASGQVGKNGRATNGSGGGGSGGQGTGNSRGGGTGNGTGGNGGAGSSNGTAGNGGGGGGAGGNGVAAAGSGGASNSHTGSGGGIGVSSNISGSSISYGAGGGGGYWGSTSAASVGGTGGSSCGGNGGAFANAGVTSGTTNRGCGGGGFGDGNTPVQNSTSGAGGSGVIIVRFATVTEVDTLTIKENKVGIGTVAPNGILTVKGTSGTAVGIFGSLTNSHGALRIMPQSASVQLTSRNSVDTTYKDLDLRTGASSNLYINTTGDVGIGTASPARKLHISDLLRIQPRSAAPTSPALGDIYVDSDTNELCFYSTAWQALVTGTDTNCQ